MLQNSTYFVFPKHGNRIVQTTKHACRHSVENHESPFPIVYTAQQHQAFGWCGMQTLPSLVVYTLATHAINGAPFGKRSVIYSRTPKDIMVDTRMRFLLFTTV